MNRKQMQLVVVAEVRFIGVVAMWYMYGTWCMCMCAHVILIHVHGRNIRISLWVEKLTPSSRCIQLTRGIHKIALNLVLP